MSVLRGYVEQVTGCRGGDTASALGCLNLAGGSDAEGRVRPPW